jgi:thiol-disulfide isomerase/thioredoxin
VTRVLVAGLIVSLASACSRPGPSVVAPAVVAAEANADHRPLVIVVHADWCAACRHAAPAVAWLREEYGARVTFIDLDVTDDAAVTQSATKASRLGLGPFFEENRGQPGVTVLGKNRTTVRRFGAEYRAAPYRSAVEQALASFEETHP